MLNQKIKIFSPNVSDLFLVYRVIVFDVEQSNENKTMVADTLLIGEEHQDIFTESLKEIQKFIPTHTIDDIEKLVNKHCTYSNNFTFGKYEFVVMCDCDCIETIKI